MSRSNSHVLDQTENCDFVHGLFEKRLGRGEIDLPLLPEVAIRVMRVNAGDRSSAVQLAEIIDADATLTAHVLRVAASAAERPLKPIVTLRHAVTWLGFDRVADIAFTMALQGRILNVPGQNHKARRLWRHALACALWSRHISRMLAREAAESYLSGLLHTIGKPVALAAAHDLARRSQTKLSSEEYDLLIEIFHRHLGALVVKDWGLPEVVQVAATQWEAYAGAGELRLDCNIVHVAHSLANFTVDDCLQDARGLLTLNPAYLDLGLRAEDESALFDAGRWIVEDLESYLPI
jgi:HD-like signal output (HDOD) protein